MFTGLVEETGEVISVEEAGEGKRIEIAAEKVFEDASEGDSISVSGACLTVESLTDSGATFFLAEETLERTWFSNLSAADCSDGESACSSNSEKCCEGDHVNLERSLKAEDRMGGHYVQGHVDEVAVLEEVEELEEGWNFRFSTDYTRYIVEKGFLAVDGISLTITEVTGDGFAVTIIPETWNVTNFSELEEHDQVNIEYDVMAKYAEKILKR